MFAYSLCRGAEMKLRDGFINMTCVCVSTSINGPLFKYLFRSEGRHKLEVKREREIGYITTSLECT